MNRRSFFKMGAACFGTAAATRPASAFVPAHNWDGYNWGTARRSTTGSIKARSRNIRPSKCSPGPRS